MVLSVWAMYVVYCDIVSMGYECIVNMYINVKCVCM